MSSEENSDGFYEKPNMEELTTDQNEMMNLSLGYIDDILEEGAYSSKRKVTTTMDDTDKKDSGLNLKLDKKSEISDTMENNTEPNNIKVPSWLNESAIMEDNKNKLDDLLSTMTEKTSSISLDASKSSIENSVNKSDLNKNQTEDSSKGRRARRGVALGKSNNSSATVSATSLVQSSNINTPQDSIKADEAKSENKSNSNLNRRISSKKKLREDKSQVSTGSRSSKGVPKKVPSTVKENCENQSLENLLKQTRGSESSCENRDSISSVNSGLRRRNKTGRSTKSELAESTIEENHSQDIKSLLAEIGDLDDDIFFDDVKKDNLEASKPAPKNIRQSEFDRLPVELQICLSCKKEIGSKSACKSNSGYWHSNHFLCSACRKPLVNQPFFEVEDKLYCDNDFKKLYMKMCQVCKEPIEQEMIILQDKFFHKEHFTCQLCDFVIGENPYYIMNNQVVCVDCYKNRFATLCKACDSPIIGNTIQAFNLPWHPNCFKCVDCQEKLQDGHCNMYEDKLYCLADFYKIKGTKCTVCDLLIMGKSIKVGDSNYHPEHFTCSFCTTTLLNKTYKTKYNRQYCLDCFENMI